MRIGRGSKVGSDEGRGSFDWVMEGHPDQVTDQIFDVISSNVSAQCDDAGNRDGQLNIQAAVGFGKCLGRFGTDFRSREKAA